MRINAGCELGFDSLQSYVRGGAAKLPVEYPA